MRQENQASQAYLLLDFVQRLERRREGRRAAAYRVPVTHETPVIQVENLSKRFGEIVAVSNVSFLLPARSTTALLGGNGAGKSTTISMLLGLLLPTTGTIRVFGEDMLRNRYRAFGRMSFSSPYIDLPQRLTVRQNLTVYAMLYGLYRIRDRLETIAEDLDL